MRGRQGGAALWTLVALAPWLAPYAVHCWIAEGTPTGFLQYDGPYYVANGRATFERGDGLFYPNAYDPRPDAPAIYCHWAVWLLGLGVSVGGLDPGAWFCTLGLVGALAAARLTFALADTVAPGASPWAGLALLWGGGAMTLAAVGLNMVAGRPWHADLYRFDPMQGWWALPWGRNLLLPMEAIYHALAAGCFLTALRDRPAWSLLWAGLLAATHPFSGFQVLAISFAWWTLEAVVRRRRRRAAFAAAALMAAFLAYNLVYLERFPGHRALREVWSIAWSLPWSALVLGHLPVLVPAVWRTCAGRPALDRAAAFCWVAFAVSIALAKHDLLIAPRQPLHFTRGYIWLPLALLALPVWWDWGRRGGPMAKALLAIGFLVLAVDNAAFLARITFWRADRGEPEVFLTREERAMFREVSRIGARGVAWCPDFTRSYLLGAYTPLRPYRGHHFNTPDSTRRQIDSTRWLRHDADAPPFPPCVDHILITRKERLPRNTTDFALTLSNRELLFYSRRRLVAAPLAAD